MSGHRLKEERTNERTNDERTKGGEVGKNLMRICNQFKQFVDVWLVASDDLPKMVLNVIEEKMKSYKSVQNIKCVGQVVHSNLFVCCKLRQKKWSSTLIGKLIGPVARSIPSFLLVS